MNELAIMSIKPIDSAYEYTLAVDVLCINYGLVVCSGHYLKVAQ